MKKEYNVGLLLLFLIIFIILLINKLYTYCIIVGTVILILVIYFIYKKMSEKDDEFNKKINSIIKKYDAVLVRTSIPDLSNKNIISVDKFEDLIDAQVEIRKPIFYNRQTEVCSFILLDQENALIHTFKACDGVVSPIDIALSDIEIKKKKSDVDYSILKDIEKTTIVKLENNKSYKVSPIKKSSNDEEIEII